MHVEINAADGVERSPALDEHIHAKLARIDRHFGEHLTQVRVFLKDVNAGKGGVDKCCHMEARAERHDPVVVEAMNTDAYRVVAEAVDKLDRALEHRLARAAGRR